MAPEDVEAHRRALIRKWVARTLSRRGGANIPALPDYLAENGIPRLHIANLNGQLKEDELIERHAQYVLARVFPGGKLNVHALTEWDLVYDLGPYPRTTELTVDEVRRILEHRMREWLKHGRGR